MGLTQGIEWVLWLIIFVISAWLIATKAASRHFLHGFLLGLLSGVVHSVIQTAFFDIYLANNVQVAQQFGNIPGGLPPSLLVLLSGPVIGVVSGLVLGLFALLAGKIVKKRPTSMVAA